MKSIDHALIMAAGRGVRMMPLTESIPKPMAPYNGSTLIANGIRKLRPHIKNVHITVGYKGAVLAEHVISLGVDSVLNTEGNGNVWWLFNTLMRYLDAPVCILTADNVTDIDFDILAKEYFHLGEPACMVVPVEPVVGLEGDFIHQKENLVLELSRHKSSSTYCSGIQVLNPALINRLVEPVDDFYALWSQLIEQKRLYCSDIYPSQWYTVDTIDQLKALNERKSKE
ncbi:NTP transferase domain-containing protein [Imperialibacter roseus]|uniref:NTP transferase domain-containing protein n=1 Tax=Imperialibacter roseus TaxID=1324217 RepID=A0ABZ0IM68_9BACT|nr:sugar phosphate nucleotidyltransferase [Imperialibacter roseus]WOK05574.1 NTP transferase domain-containing protein [Imperialibacter roseus]